jgi:hypothetical protein
MEAITETKKRKKTEKPQPLKPASKPKGLALNQLAKKKYADIDGLDAEFKECYGDIDEAFDIIFFGDSSNGKTNAVAQFVEKMINTFNCKCSYISYEEGHGKTMRQVLIDQHNLHEKHGNCLTLYENFTFEQLDYYINKQRSPKIWVFDSIQASGLSWEQFKVLKARYVMGKAKKIFVYISWADGKLPSGAIAKSVRYYANIKVRVEGFICFIRSRYGSKKNFVSYPDGAKTYWGKHFKKMLTKK